MTKKISRRDVLKVGALGMLGGLAACSPVARATEALLPTAPQFPTSTSAPAATSGPGTAPTATHSATVTTLINDIASHATRYVDSLDQAQRTKSTYAFNDPELTHTWTSSVVLGPANQRSA